MLKCTITIKSILQKIIVICYTKLVNWYNMSITCKKQLLSWKAMYPCDLFPTDFTSTDAVCGFCSIKTNQLKKCSGCKDVSYCSRECQKQDWSRGHKSKCKMVGHKERPSLPGMSMEDNSSKDETTPVMTDPERCSKCKIGGELKLCQS